MSLLVQVQAAVFVATLALTAGSSVAPASEQSQVDWLKGSGKDLQICLKGEVFNADGRPATGAQVTGRMTTEIASKEMVSSVDGNKFTVCFPVSQSRWYSAWISVKSADGQRVAYKTLYQYELRQAAIDGIKLTLQPPTHQVAVKVTDQGRPVAGAKVKAQISFLIELHSTTNADGIAQISLLPDQELLRLTAWTDDHRIGGYSFNRKPTRDPKADEYVVELNKCRDQKLRFVDEKGAPVSGVDFVLQIASLPNYNFIGTNDHSRMTTSAAGEAVFQWFPDWEKVFYYAEGETGPWVIDRESKIVDGVAIFNLRKSKPRKRVEGRVIATGTSPGGFFAELETFQAEREHMVDRLNVFSDGDGKFAVDVLPDATYCAFVLDARWVGAITNSIPYDLTTDKLNPPQLAVSQGQEVEVIATTGPEKKPFANLRINFRREHKFSWREGGKTRNGSSGPQSGATTDESGRATIRTLPGTLKASVTTPQWNTEQEVIVSNSKPTKIQFHRELEKKRTLTGRLVLDKNVAASLNDAEVQIGAVDGNYDDRQSLTCGKDGSFSFGTFASVVGLFARTQDGQAAGSMVVKGKDLDVPIELRLRPTSHYDGQLLGSNEQPVAGHTVVATIRVQGDEDYKGRFVKYFDAKRIETKSDDQGNFTLRDIPAEVKVYISANAIDGSSDTADLDEVYLEPNESRPRIKRHLVEKAVSQKLAPLAKRYEAMLRDCRMAGFRLMLIIAEDNQDMTDFVNQHYLEFHENKDIYPFMQLAVRVGKSGLDPTDTAFLNERNWMLPKDGHVSAISIDSTGKELGRLDTDARRNGAAEEVARFIHQQAPAPVNAKEKWDAAFAEANRSNRRVWVRVSQRYCGPCFQFARWLDDNQSLLEKDYIMLKIDDARDKNGNDVADRVTLGKWYGIPFHAIFDRNGKMLVNSAGPLGNIGNPSDFEGKKQLRKMLLQSRQNLSDAEIEQLVENIRE
jgi:hypothetical protein